MKFHARVTRLIDTDVRVSHAPAMGSFPEAVGDSDGRVRAAERHGQGPWLIVRGSSDGGDAVEQICAQATEAGIQFDVVPIEEFERLVNVGKYFGLVLVLPIPSRMRTMIAAFERVIHAYRKLHVAGLQDLLAGRATRWCDIGAVQVVVPGALARNRDVLVLCTQACAVHDISESIDVIAPYSGAPLALAELLRLEGSTEGAAIETLRPHIQTLQSWGVTSPRQVSPLVAEVMAQVALRRSNVRAVSIRRPLYDVDMTVLDFIIEGVIGDYPQLSQLSHQGNFARVQRETVQALQRVDSKVRRPGQGKNAVRDLGRFIFSLQIVDRYLRNHGDGIWPAA